MKDPLDWGHEPSSSRKMKTDEEGNPYWGNVWGWKLSRIGLVLTLVFSALFFYRACTNPEVDLFEEEAPIFKNQED